MARYASGERTEFNRPSALPNEDFDAMMGLTKSPPSEPGVFVVRTSMASPWVTVLASLAQSSQPLAYGVGGLLALQRLMKMVMEWQNHRQTLDERRQAAIRQLLLDHQRVETGAPGVENLNLAPAVAALSGLEPVLAAEMIDPQDARATGQPV
ncbi:hypothetical protein ACFQ1S_00520 [Kibdelosporangium lantanae]|uniref:Uncharacterized protein n=1 Tax=Kibdelosporangium lantanae TaxID=1497396 RepID=A0ABW3M0U2_9PSEU